MRSVFPPCVEEEPTLDQRRGAWAVFSVMAFTYCFSHFYRVSTALIAVDLAGEFGLDAGELSLLGAAFFYAFALAQIPLGPALDRFGARRIVILGVFLGAAGALLFSAGQDLRTLVAARVLMGVGMSPVLMGALTLIARWFPAGRFGTLSGMILSLGMVGALLAATPMAGLVGWLGWRGTFALVGLFTGAAGVLVWATVQDRPDGCGTAPMAVGGRWSGLLRVAASPTFWCTAPLALVGYASVASLQGLWAGPYLMEEIGFDRIHAGNALLGLSAAGAVGSVAAGWLSDRVFRSRKWVVAIGNGLALLCLLPLVGFGTPSGPAAWIALFSALGFFSAFRTLLYAHMKESLPPELVGTAVTSINFFVMSGPGLMQQAVGAVLEARPGDYRAAFGLLAGSLALGSAVYLLTRDSRPSR